MCLAIPGKLIEIDEDPSGVRMGKANFGGIVKQVCLQYTPEARMGDYVLVHVGFALGTVDEAEAERTFKLLDEMDQLSELDISSDEQGEPSPQPVDVVANSHNQP
jgi:hydrogenase expression/formation protein HypC